jgi:hypothetical protein
MAETAGIIYLQAGPDAASRTDLGSMHYDQLNNARGSNGTFINGVEKPDNAESRWDVPYRSLRLPQGLVQAHRGPGELLYVAIDAQAAGATVTGSYAIEFHEEVVNLVTGANRKVTHLVGAAVTDTTVGGIAANPGRIVGQKVPVLALRALGPNEVGRLYGYAYVLTA